MRYLLALAIFFAVGCGLVKDGSADRRDLMKEVHVDLSLEDTLVDYRIGDTLWLDVTLSNPQDTSVVVPIAGAGFLLRGSLSGQVIKPEFGFRGIVPWITTDSIRLAPGEGAVVPIGFFPFTEILAGTAIFKLTLAFDWREETRRIRFFGISSNVVRIASHTETTTR